MLIFNFSKENEDDDLNIDDDGIENNNDKDNDDAAQLGSDGFFFPRSALMTILMTTVLILCWMLCLTV